MDEARAVREYWFGTLPLSGAALAHREDFWFGPDGYADRIERDGRQCAG